MPEAHAAGQARVTSPDGLNLRAAPSTDAAVLAVLPYNSMVTVEAAASPAGWYQVHYAGNDGYADGAYLDLNAGPASPTSLAGGSASAVTSATALAPAPTPPAAGSGVAVVAPADGLRLRSGPGVNAPAIATLPSGRQVQLLGAATADGWQQVTAAEGSGWVDAAYLQPIAAGTAPVLLRWYGHDFDGGVLACGGIYSASDPGIAATNDYPCGTRLKVCALGNCVLVTVRDRGGMETGAMDLSEAAFAELAPLGAGPIHGTLQVLPGSP